GDRPPTRDALRGGGVRRLPLPLADGGHPRPRACRPAALGRRDLVDQPPVERGSSLTGRLFPELLRWKRAGRTTAIDLRWRSWARSLAARHRRVAGPWRASGTLLALPGRRTPSVRVERTAVTLAPQIRLALRSFVRSCAPPTRVLATGRDDASPARNVPERVVAPQLTVLRRAGRTAVVRHPTARCVR